ncbi:DNA (cytosine-5)-methyltransferase 1 [Actinokineospora spheciospongiae]|nr:DNA (cytosine-5)-methyltransferase 1 [Actinokineospora spheciospongiae]
MPQREDTGISALSLFSGGGGLDLGFSRIGINNVAAFEIMDDAADTIRVACPEMKVYGGEAGDVREVDWSPWRGSVDILHGGPPCQPFSHAGRQRGSLDPRDMWPEFVRAVLKIRPAVFVGENVPALGEAKFAEYVNQTILAPLSKGYHIHVVQLRAQDFGVPQIRRRIFFIGFRNKRIHGKYRPPTPTHAWNDNEALESGIVKCMGVREALGLRESGFDDLSPTIRSTLNGPRNTTSILNSVSARNRFEKLQIWPNGVAASREKAQKFPSPNGHFRLSVPDVALIQGFPDDWPFSGATYKVLGQIGNAVPPPLAYNVAASIVAALGRIK